MGWTPIAPRTHQGQAVGPAGALPLGLVVYFTVEKHKGNKFPPGEPWRAEGAALNPSLPLGFTSLVAAWAPRGGTIVTAVIPSLTPDPRIKDLGECFCHHQPSWTNQGVTESIAPSNPFYWLSPSSGPMGITAAAEEQSWSWAQPLQKRLLLKTNLSAATTRPENSHQQPPREMSLWLFGLCQQVLSSIPSC